MRLYLRRPPGQPTISKALFFLKQQSPIINFTIKPYGRLPGGKIPIIVGLRPIKDIITREEGLPSAKPPEPFPGPLRANV